MHLAEKGHLPGDVPETLWAVAASFCNAFPRFTEFLGRQTWQDLFAASGGTRSQLHQLFRAPFTFRISIQSSEYKTD